MSLAWHTAGLCMAAFVGEFPALSTLLTSAPERRPQTADDVRTALCSWLGAPPTKEPGD